MKGFGKALRRTWTGLTHSARTSSVRFVPRSPVQGYRRSDYVADLKAGLNGALLSFPQGLAYALIAGLPIVYGVTCTAVAAVIAPFFSSSRYTILGPTNATALLIPSFFAAYAGGFALQWMPLIILMAGLLLIAGSLLRVADLIQYISRSVAIGYVSAAAILIMANQFKAVLGLDFSPAAGSEAADPRSFFGILSRLIRYLPHLNLIDSALSLSTLALYLLLLRRFPKLPVLAIALVAMSIVTALLQRAGIHVATFRDQTFSLWDETSHTYSLRQLLPVPTPWGDAHLWDHAGIFFSLSLAIAFLCALESSIMAQTLGTKTGRITDKNQDMYSVGIANVAAAFLSGMPASGSPTRSALNYRDGATGPLSSIVNGLLCLVGTLTLGGLVAYVPKASLATLVICIAVSLWNWRRIRICLNATGSDAAVFLSTFIFGLLIPLNVAIFVGVGVSIALFLRKASRPYLVEYTYDDEQGLRERGSQARQNPQIAIVHVEGELFFGAAEVFRSQLQRTCVDPQLRVIILQMRNARHLDATGVIVLEELVLFLHQQARHLLISGAMPEVLEVLENSGALEVIGRENVIRKDLQNPNLAMRHALKRAQEILGTSQAEVRIYFDASKQEKKSS